MSVYVITPKGDLLAFSEARYVFRCDNGKTELYVAPDKKVWVADIPADWAVGRHRPIFATEPSMLPDIKRALQNYDARTKRWKD